MLIVQRKGGTESSAHYKQQQVSVIQESAQGKSQMKLVRINLNQTIPEEDIDEVIISGIWVICLRILSLPTNNGASEGRYHLHSLARYEQMMPLVLDARAHN